MSHIDVAGRFEADIKKILTDCGVSSVVAGVSGGADSTALVSALAAAGVAVNAVHINYHLRGEESMRDMNHTRRLCDNLNIPLEIIDVDVAAYRSRHRCSTEEACRDLRYAEFRRIMNDLKCHRIAVAHNRDDNAETVLLNLFRGSGVSGLRSMLPDTGEIIRPLLHFSRAEILEYLSCKQLDYVTDSSNLESGYRRNFIRNEILPLIETRWPEVKKSIAHTATIMRSEEKALRHLERSLIPDEATRLPYSTIKCCFDPSWLIHRFASRFGASPAQSVSMTQSVLSPNFVAGRAWKVPGGRICAGRKDLYFINNISNAGVLEQSIICHAMLTPDQFKEELRSQPINDNSVLYTTLERNEINFRHPVNADRISPLGMSGSQLISKILKDAKFDTDRKEQVVVAAAKDTDEIIWVEGLKRSRKHLIHPDTEKIYKYWVER